MASIAAGFLVSAPSARAQTTLSMDDTNFIMAAAQGGMTEVKMGQLASTNGIRDDVKSFGRMMVKDHTSINNDLKVLAAQKGMTWPDRLDAKHQEMADSLAALTGSGFDDAYINLMIKVHQNDDKAFKAESAAAKDTDIISFLDKFTPTVESHLKQAALLKK